MRRLIVGLAAVVILAGLGPAKGEVTFAWVWVGKLGSDTTPINVNAKGVIPIALFTTDDFDVSWVDVSSVEFAGASPDHFAFEDLDDDGDLDLIMHFRIEDTNLRDVYTNLINEDMSGSYRLTVDMALTGQASKDGDEFFDFSGEDTLELFATGKKLKGEVPVLLSPEEGAEMDNGRTDRQDDKVWDFDWTDVEGATRYHLYVKHEGAAFPVIDRQGLTASQYNDISTGSYISNTNRLDWRWKVRAYTSDGWSDWSEIRSFDVEPVNTD